MTAAEPRATHQFRAMLLCLAAAVAPAAGAAADAPETATAFPDSFRVLEEMVVRATLSLRKTAMMMTVKKTHRNSIVSLQLAPSQGTARLRRRY